MPEDVGGGSLEYLYNFVDCWEHSPRIERITEAAPGVAYPDLIEAVGGCSSENVGGPRGYREFLEAIADPGRHEHAERVQWIGRHFDPTDADVQARARPSIASPGNGAARVLRAAGGDGDTVHSRTGKNHRTTWPPHLQNLTHNTVLSGAASTVCQRNGWSVLVGIDDARAAADDHRALYAFFIAHPSIRYGFFIGGPRIGQPQGPFRSETLIVIEWPAATEAMRGRA